MPEPQPVHSPPNEDVPPDADEAMASLSDAEWKRLHDLQLGDGSPIPDDQLAHVYEPGKTVEDLGGEEAVKNRITGGDHRA